ncbi:MAG: nucleotidyl transferase AbiEii/AbiGii toxin family protein [Methanobacteriota archaeon]
MEIAHQLARRIPGLVLKGGTSLQSRISWPPQRASVDVDLEWRNPAAVMRALQETVGQWRESMVTVDPPVQVPFAVVSYIRFPGNRGQELVVRVDVSEPGSSMEHSEPWRDAPAPWRGAADLRVPTLEAQAAQKLLLAAPPHFGRDLANHHGRQNLCKDLFDLHALGALDLDNDAIQKAAGTEVRMKGKLLQGRPDQERIVNGARETWMCFAHPRAGCPPECEALWRAYLRVRPTIRAPFADGDLRIAAGCAHHAVSTLFDDGFEWSDAWTPRRTKKPRKAWQGITPIEPVTPVSDEFSGARGLLEAWAKPGREPR